MAAAVIVMDASRANIDNQIGGKTSKSSVANRQKMVVLCCSMTVLAEGGGIWCIEGCAV